METMKLEFMRPKRNITKWPFAVAESLFWYGPRSFKWYYSSVMKAIE